MTAAYMILIVFISYVREQRTVSKPTLTLPHCTDITKRRSSHPLSQPGHPFPEFIHRPPKLFPSKPSPESCYERRLVVVFPRMADSTIPITDLCLRCQARYLILSTSKALQIANKDTILSSVAVRKELNQIRSWATVYVKYLSEGVTLLLGELEDSLKEGTYLTHLAISDRTATRLVYRRDDTTG